MNISVLSLVTSSLFAHSPLFVGSQLTFINGHFKKVSSTIFYNQKNLFLKDSTFTQIYGTILHNSNENNHQTIDGEEFSSSNKFDIEIGSVPQSITIQNCKFNGIKNEGDCKNPFSIENNGVSLYITDSLFNNCKSVNGIIYLKCRCFTMTHTCSFGSQCEYRNCFLYYECLENDFSIILYNTICNSQILNQNNKKVTANMYFSFGDQYLKCNNMTQMPFNGFQFDNVQCFSFQMNTVNNADHSCLYLSGLVKDETNNNNNNKNIEMINFKSDSSDNFAQIRFAAQSNFKFIATKCFFLTNGNVFGQDGNLESQTITIFIDNCAFQEGKIGMTVTSSNPTYVSGVDTSNFFKIPHFTYGDICQGKKIEADVSIKACNVGNCKPENCERTIGFPEGVVPYTSVFHTDIQTATFTPSNYFTESAKFSKSFDFTKSNEFTQSNDFSPSRIKIAPLNPTEKDDDDDDNKGNGGNKDNKGKTIGIAVGVVAGVAIIAAVAAIILIKRRQKLNMSLSDGDVISQETNTVTVDNALQKEMDKDDPFADDFQIENP